MATKLFLFFSLITMLSCTNQPALNNTSTSKDDSIAVIQADEDFNTYCSQHGTSAAFIKYSGSNALEMGQGKLPVMGINAVKNFYAKRNDTTSSLSWYPVRALACNSLGYTFGEWQFKDKTSKGADTILYGVYVTIWKKQTDGTWKYVLDGGNDTPKPMPN